jgi:hypothetical protein
MDAHQMPKAPEGRGFFFTYLSYFIEWTKTTMPLLGKIFSAWKLLQKQELAGLVAVEI